MRVRHALRKGDKIELKMTAMIDIVFLLLIFFIMTFTIVAPEGDFNIRMPLATAGPGQEPLDPQIPPIKIRLVATGAGHLAGIRMNERDFGRNFHALNMQLRQIVGHGAGDAAEVEIDADYALQFEYVMDAITAVSGYVGPEGNVIKVCEKIKFAPPRPAQ
ncbi:MAG: biopolymer transporter ExbD [Thermoguttaceae bacterium]|jgi:biopolymer transport protein ExbD|nr:biopolymer transporter ExbD [Thermoguttaceae bacterium]